MERKKYFWLIWVLAFVGALLVLSQIGYSDGDDAYFYQTTHDMKFTQYIRMRYDTWVGRVAAEALVYLTFHLGLWFWRIVNALMLVLLPFGILKLASCVSGVTEKLPDLPAAGKYGEDGYRDGENWKAGAAAAATVLSGYLLMDAMTLGYAAVWVNGSIFYTWTFACGIWALVPIARCVFGQEAAAWDRAFLYSLPCAVIACMSIEQMGAVLLTFELLALIYCIWKRRRIPVLPAIQTLCSAAAYAVLFAAPGNAIRTAEEIKTWMPEYDALGFGHHLFLTVQWMLSSFANENRLFFCAIWIVGILLLRQRRLACRDAGAGTAKAKDMIWEGAAVLFTGVALLPFAGIGFCSDMGMKLSEMTVRMEHVLTPADLTAANWFAMCWWGVAVIFTLFFLWKISNADVTLMLIYLAGIASEAILFFSPTMYASGARVFYLTDLLYMLLVLCLAFRLKKRCGNLFAGILLVLGICNLIYQLPLFLAHI